MGDASYGADTPTMHWLKVAAALVGSGLALAFMLNFVGVNGWRFVGLMWIGAPVAPMEAMILLNGWMLWEIAAADMYVIFKIALGVAAFVNFGVHSGLVLTIFCKASPRVLERILTVMSGIAALPWHVAMKVLPLSFQRGVGVVITFLSEFLILPCATCILYVFAELKMAGSDFDFDHNQRISDPTTPLVVFIHGNRFNECQWLYGRLRMHTMFPHAKFMTVNYFSGASLRQHSKETETIEGCAKLALAQLLKQIDEQGLRPSRVILQGHSLGGIVSALIAEGVVGEHGLNISTIVAWSAPFRGGAAFDWVKKQEGYIKERYYPTEGINLDFLPDSPKLENLRGLISKSVKTKKRIYLAVTGWCDSLVRPDSATIPECIDEACVLIIPHVGHYNIMISKTSWHSVGNYLQQRDLVGTHPESRKRD